MRRLAWLSLLCLTADTATAAAFVNRPTAAVEGKAIRIAFAVDEPADVAVEVLNAKGETVRHLAAGLLGDNAQPPLQKDSLEQSLVWDRTDDLGEAAPAGAYSVRVGLGLSPRLKEVVGWRPLGIGSVFSVAAAPEGGVYVLGRPRGGVVNIIQLDADGAYVRKLMPPPATADLSSYQGMNPIRLNGAWIPMGQPLAMSAKGTCPMAVTGDDLMIWPSQYQSKAPHRIARIGLKSAVLHSIRKGIGCKDHRFTYLGMALSPDRKHAYLTGSEWVKYTTFRPLHAVYKADLEAGAFGPFLGDAAESGCSASRLRRPTGLATDKAGALYVADSGNNRVLVVSPDGAVQREISTPEGCGFIVVNQETGDLYVMDKPIAVSITRSKGKYVRKFNRDGKEVASFLLMGRRKGIIYPCVSALALDAAGEKPVLWVGIKDDGYCRGGGLIRVVDEGAAFGKPRFLDCASFGAQYDPRYLYHWGGSYREYVDAFNMKYYADEGRAFSGFGALDPKPGLWADGNIYQWNVPANFYRTKWESIRLQRFGPDKSPLAFPSLDSDGLRLIYAPSAPWFPQRGVMVDRRSNVLVRYTYKLKAGIVPGIGGKDAMITGVQCHDATGKRVGHLHLTNSTYGLGTDARGNIYLGDKPRPVGIQVPLDLEKALGGKVPTSIADRYGAVYKFTARSGGFEWTNRKPVAADAVARTRGNRFPATVPLDSDRHHYNHGNRIGHAKGAAWLWVGMSVVPTYHSCICYGSDLKVDPHGRVFVPDEVCCRIAVLDAAGNLLRTIGAYGNSDSRGKGSPVPTPEIAFCKLRMITDVTSRQVRAADNNNGWVSVIRLDYATETRVPVSLSN